MRFLASAVLLVLGSLFVSSVCAVDFTIQQAPVDGSALLTNPQLVGSVPLNVQPQWSTLPNVNLQAQPMINNALLNQMQMQGQGQGQQALQSLQSLTPQQYQQLLQQQALLTNPLLGAQSVMTQLFPQQQQQQQQAALNPAAYAYNPYNAAINPYANQFAANPFAANYNHNPSGVSGLVQQTAQQIAQAMNPGIGGPGIGGGVGNPFGPGVGGIGIGGIGGPGPAPFGPGRP